MPDAEGLIKLDAMENPYSWPPEMVEAWTEALREVTLNRYPDPGAAHLKQRLRDTFKIPAASAVLLGNGSDELIQMILMAVGGAGRVVVAPEPSFSMYRIISTNVGDELSQRGAQRGFLPGCGRHPRRHRRAASGGGVHRLSQQSYRELIRRRGYLQFDRGGAGAWWWWTRPIPPSATPVSWTIWRVMKIC